MDEKRDGFIFYRSFFESVQTLNKRDQTAVILAICDYALNGVEPSLSGAALSVWILIKPVMDANYRRYKCGKKGGRPKTEPKPNDNQSKTKSEPNDNQTVTESKPNIRQEIKDKRQEIKDNRQEMPAGLPSLSEIETFCLENQGTSAQAAAFYAQYSRAGWRADGKPIENWKGLLMNYLRSGGGKEITCAASTTTARVPSNARKNTEWMRRILESNEDG